MLAILFEKGVGVNNNMISALTRIQREVECFIAESSRLMPQRTINFPEILCV